MASRIEHALESTPSIGLVGRVWLVNQCARKRWPYTYTIHLQLPSHRDAGGILIGARNAPHLPMLKALTRSRFTSRQFPDNLCKDDMRNDKNQNLLVAFIGPTTGFEVHVFPSESRAENRHGKINA
jgi:hypothetical protein